MLRKTTSAGLVLLCLTAAVAQPSFSSGEMIIRGTADVAVDHPAS